MKTTIRFPLVKERTGWRRGRRFHLVPAEQGRTGLESSIRATIRCAIRARNMAKHPITTPRNAKIDRLQMRIYALMARSFAHHLHPLDTRIAETERAAKALAFAQETAAA